MGFYPEKAWKNGMDQSESEALNFFSEDKVIGGMIVCFFGGFRISL